MNPPKKTSTSPSRLLIGLLAALAVLLIIATFFTGRCVGIKEGQRDAAQQIEQQGKITAGPDSLI